MKNKCIIFLTIVKSLVAATANWTPQECVRVAQALCSNEYFPPEHLVEGSRRQAKITFPADFDFTRGNIQKEVLDRKYCLKHLLAVMPGNFDTSCFYGSSCNITTAISYLLINVHDKDIVRTALTSRNQSEMPFTFFRAIHSADGPEQILRTMGLFLSWHQQATQPYARLFQGYTLAIAYKFMGYSAFKLGRPQDALRYYQQSLALNRTGETLYNISSCYALLRDNQNAKLYVEQASQLGFSLEENMHHADAVRADELPAYQRLFDRDPDQNQVLGLDEVRGIYNLGKTNPLTPRINLFYVGCMYVERASDPVEIQGVLRELISYLRVMEIDIESVKCFNQKVLTKELTFPEVRELIAMFLEHIRALQRAENYQMALNVCANLSNFPGTQGIMEEILHEHSLMTGRPALAISLDNHSGTMKLSGGTLASFKPTDVNRGFLHNLRSIGVDIQSELYQNALAQVEANCARRTREDMAEPVEDAAIQQQGSTDRPVVRSRGYLRKATSAAGGAAAAACDSDHDETAASLTFDSRLALIEAERIAKVNGYMLPEDKVFELSMGSASGGGSGTVQTLYELIGSNRIELAHFRPHTHYEFDENKSKAILWQFYLLQEVFKVKQMEQGTA